MGSVGKAKDTWQVNNKLVNQLPINQGNHKVKLLDDSGKLKGMIEYEVENSNVNISFLMTKKSFYNQGVATNLLKNVTDLATAKNLSVTLLALPLLDDSDSMSQNELVDWYKKRGFEVKEKKSVGVLMQYKKGN